jgi:peptide/nickel transport system substrate-binding protein
LANANSQFVRLLTDAVYSIIPAKYIAGKTIAQYAASPFVVTKPVGTGPYKLLVFKRDQYMSFIANKKYFKGAPNISFVTWYLNVKAANFLPMLQKGQLDLAVNIPQSLSAQLAKLKAYNAVWNNTTAGEFFQFRADQGMAANKLVRQAVMYAIDRRSMLKNLFNGHGTIRWILGGFDQENIPGLDQYPYDPVKAKALLAQSGVDLTQNFEIMYAPDGDPEWPLMVPVMQQYLQAVGLKVTLNPVDVNTWVAKQSDPKTATYALTLNSGGSLGLGESRSSIYFNCKTPLTSFYSNCALDQLFADLFATADKAKQDVIKAKIAVILNTDVPFVTIWENQTLNAISTRLGGAFKLTANDRDSLFNIEKWTLAPKN